MRFAVLLLCVLCGGCACTEVVVRVGVTCQGQTVGIKMRENQMELYADLVEK